EEEEEEEGKEEAMDRFKPNLLRKRYGYVFEDEHLHCESFPGDHKSSQVPATYILSRNAKLDICSKGTLNMSNYLLHFEPDDPKTIPGGSRHLTFPLAYIAKLSYGKPKAYIATETTKSNINGPGSTSKGDGSGSAEGSSPSNIFSSSSSNLYSPTLGDMFEVEIITRQYQPLRFQIDKANRVELHLFAFGYARKHPIAAQLRAIAKQEEDLQLQQPSAKASDVWGWYTYNAEREYRRMGIPVPVYTFNDTANGNNTNTNTNINTNGITNGNMLANANGECNYRVTRLNDKYEICDTYPRVLVVPAVMRDDEIRQVALFRRLGRIPALTWKDPNSNVAIFRCSQPKVGVTGQRSPADEKMIEWI
ncbi:hypothetical protein RFI_31098, partial [Reticulomyxa filosa]